MKPIVLSYMEPSKVTDNKLRWQTDVDGVPFKLYVPKWRVPTPWPRQILVRISSCDGPVDRTRGRQDDLLRPIVTVVHRTSDHTGTVRFTPAGDPRDWELGEPYIPYSLLPEPTVKELVVEVEWNLRAGTWEWTKDDDYRKRNPPPPE
jgi:hypothetical protein